jgi:hypothetical protein
MPYSLASEIALDLNNCRSGFDINPSAITDRGLEKHVREVTSFKFKRGRQNKLAYIRLYFGFSSPLVATN